ncbi:beta-ketoacyl synthase N-terminal-like domain-containing protein [Pelatocladus sp. BLCC-F211]|uniref:beta-ketoacyl synthase N-terminal-like domain-containing protein n=1 Tax=Pelatocladus sp. BLCC-F211 TaxID=3342752 RepID=UPI0035B8273C
MESIAIVGIGCRFPKTNNPKSFWHLLRNGVDAITEVPSDRWDIDAFYDPDPLKPGKMNTRWGGFLEQVSQFDANFFGISPREAERMDPQHRLVMEVAWEALENAGLLPGTLAGTQTGVFIGIGNYDYGLLLRKNLSRANAYDGIGSSFSIAPNRLSYLLNLRGPSVAIDTACSSSLVALHYACQSLERLECNLCLAGGVNLILTPELTVALSQAKMMAADGHCKAFDAKADGYARGEGCGVVVLKRLSDALRDRDRIHALIRGSAINQDGMSNGLTAPNGLSQQAVIRQALENANVQPAQISYVETHGTGTLLGDPIEIESLQAELMPGRSLNQPCWIGSVKTNIGHLESAAGIAGLIKVILSLQYKQIPSNLHLKQLNPYISLAGTPFSIPTECVPWSVGTEPRLAGVSSFGIGGTNCHVILEEAPLPIIQDNDIERPLHLLTLSAKTEDALRELARRYGDFLVSHPESLLADVCFTANAGRSHFEHRLAVVAESTLQLHEKLSLYAAGQQPSGLVNGDIQSKKRLKIAFLFSGQGSQYACMGRQLYQTHPTFRKVLDDCDRILHPYLKSSLLSVLDPTPDAPQLLHNTEYTQPALFALEYALAELWRSWGIVPDMVMGHSVGEYVAACVAGIFSFEDALKLIAERGRLMQSLPQDGIMAAVFADVTKVAGVVATYAKTVAIAGVNGPHNTVISGTRTDVEAILHQLEVTGIKSILLKVSQAFHSPAVEPILADFAQVANQIKYNIPQIPLISNLTGHLATEVIATPEYWCRHARAPVQFAPAIKTLHDLGIQIFIEIGPNPILVGMGSQCLPEGSSTWLPSLRQNIEDWQQLLNSLGNLYARGADINWLEFDRDYHRSRLSSLPNYPFQRKRYWVEETLEKSPQLQPPLHLWDSLVEAGRHQSHKGVSEYSLPTRFEQNQSMHKLCITYINLALKNLGAFHQIEAYTLDDLMHQFSIRPCYQQLVSRWLEIMVENGELQKKGDYFTDLLPISFDNDSIESLLKEVKKQWEGTPELVELIQRCGEHLAEILTGKEEIRALLFPGGSLDTMEKLYRDTQFSSYYNAIAKEVLQTVVKTLAPDTNLRIIEIGAGTGGTTSWLLPVLPEHRTTYTFTDISTLFLNKATKKFRKYPFLQCSLLDIEQSPQDQGYKSHSYDLVVAANVLHATRNLEQTLQNLQSLLAPGGLLLVWEVTQPLLWFDVAFGALVQPIEDKQLRQNQPFISVEQWQQLLQSQGFVKVESFPESGFEAEVLGQHILIAQAPISATLSFPAAFMVQMNAGSAQKAFRKNLISPATDLETAIHPLLGYKLRSALSNVQFESHLTNNSLLLLKDFPASGKVVLPATAQLEINLAALMEVFGSGAKTLKNIAFKEDLSLPEEETKVVQSILSPTGTEKCEFQIYSLLTTAEEREASWTLHFTGEFCNSFQVSTEEQPLTISIEEIQARCPNKVSDIEFYQTYFKRALQYEETYQGIEALWRRDEEVLAQLRLPSELAATVDNYYIHPALLDACIQIVGTSLPTQKTHNTPENGYAPVNIDTLQFYHKPGTKIWSYVILRSVETLDQEIVTANLHIFNENQEIAVSVIGLHLQPVRAQKSELVRQLETALPGHRQKILTNFICNEVAKVLNLDAPNEISVHKGWFEMGMDSLTAIEFKSRLELSVGQRLPSTLAFDYPNTEALTCYLIENVFAWEFSKVRLLESENVNTDQQNIEFADIEQLSEDELVTLLAEELTHPTEVN